jgi:GAF domain-containing protein
METPESRAPVTSERLQALYELSRRLGSFTDLGDLLRHATQRARELLHADGCALLLFDAARNELYFPVASQAESRSASERRLTEVRFPSDRGIAGWVLARGEAVCVEDVKRDPRFYPGVDQITAMDTRSVLCAPLRTGWGTIGVIEVVNPASGFRGREDLAFLEALATDIAFAHEKVRVYERLRADVTSLRQACRWAGSALVAVGIVLLVWAVVGHLAVALPLRELATRPGFWIALVPLVLGFLVFFVAARAGTASPGR